MKRTEIIFKAGGQPVSQGAPLKLKHTIDEAYQIVQDFIRANWRECLKEPVGEKLRDPFLSPGGGYGTLWDWDAFFMACAIPDEGIRYGRGSICNLIACMDPVTGKPAKNVMPDGSEDEISRISHPYPLQAQFVYLMSRRMGDFSWAEAYWDSLEKMICWHDQNCMKNGYYVWTSMYGNGIDNNPAVYGRAKMSSAGIDLANFYYREFRAMEKLSVIWKKGKEELYRKKAEKLREQIQNDYFDQVDNIFYNIDCSTDYASVTLQEVTWVTHLKFKSFASLFALWGKTATTEQAKALRDWIMSEDAFLSCCGIRSHSKSDPIYNNVPMGNPSNWQGPVWGLSTFLTAYGLARYGYREEALDVAGRLIRTFAADIEQNGALHEIYHGDTGEPVMRPGFLSWNLLGLKVLDDLRSGTDCTTLDLLD